MAIVKNSNKSLDPKKTFKVRGTIIETMPGTKFKIGIKLQEQEHEITGYISGKMRMHYIKLQVGDEVEVEMTPYDLKKGRIIYRY
ncbi:MAG: translation initiation factor IF-1 [Candidatus Dojkabacteria bacterium]|uniref:Translation initiation factor IF-1 n=2 Tax=Candidatus Dojkabacteria TaxID=74243 RepID=A0A136KLA6_9BACT|nr:MAG: Translation initiation factor IF-1 [candidate division WS6 bacterium OLB21]MBW7953604.1 translation initiation factor IF-1 [Candidatus Dojkabacteria bacterium]WKZ27878.1 MAG: translation initiation factor IF-1 [Candidatus Dojkabacteria bacterium]